MYMYSYVSIYLFICIIIYIYIYVYIYMCIARLGGVGGHLARLGATFSKDQMRVVPPHPTP